MLKKKDLQHIHRKVLQVRGYKEGCNYATSHLCFSTL